MTVSNSERESPAETNQPGQTSQDKLRGGRRQERRKAKKITRLGFEPRLTEPKSVVLPLHHQASQGQILIDFALSGNAISQLF